MANDAVATRTVMRVVRGMPTSDGAGVKLTRVIGQSQLPDLDPFLLLDEFGTDKAEDYIAGFPDHPHRGFETVTYMLDGRMRVIRKAGDVVLDRKSTRLNSSHGYISYAVFCLKKKKTNCQAAVCTSPVAIQTRTPGSPKTSPATLSSSAVTPTILHTPPTARARFLSPTPSLY